MRVAALIIGLVITALVGFQSMSILTGPFVPRVYGNAAAVGVMIAIIFAIGAGFALSSPKISAIAFGVAALASLTAGSTTPYADLRFWGVVGFALAVMSMLAGRGAPQRPTNTAPPFGGAATESIIMPKVSSVAESVPPAGEADIVAQLERLGRLQASGALSDEEFATLKADLLSQKAN